MTINSNVTFISMSRLQLTCVHCKKVGKNVRHFDQCCECLSIFCNICADEEELSVKTHATKTLEVVPDLPTKLAKNGRVFNLDKLLCLNCYIKRLVESGLIQA